MTKIKWTVAALVIAGLASPIANADAKSYKHHKSQSSAMTGTNKKMTDKNKSTAATGTNKSPGTTTGANTKSSSGNPSSQGNTGPGTNHAGSMNKNY